MVPTSAPAPWLWGVLLISCLLQGCSAFPQLIRHRDPLSPDQHMQLAASYEAQGMKENADQQYMAALQRQKNYIPALVAKGNAAFGRNDLKEAEKCYRRVLRLEPAHAGANNNLAMIYVVRGTELKQAETYAQKALQQEGPLKPYVLDTLATLYIKQGRWTEARQVLDQADAAAPAENKALRDQLTLTRKNLPLH